MTLIVFLADCVLWFQMFGDVVVSTCLYLLTDMRSEGIVMTMRLLELCIRANPDVGLEKIKPALPNIFK